jgi:hypothetical protein
MATIEQQSWWPTAWTVVDSKTNAVATATKAADSTKQHYLTGISFSMSAAPAAAVTVQVLDGATVIDQFQIPAAAQAPIIANYVPPIQITPKNSLSSTVGALGAGVVGTVVLKGKTFMAP